MNQQLRHFQVFGGGWPIRGGSVVVPSGTFLSRDDWTYLGFELPWPPPENLIPLTQDAYNEMAKHHPYYRIITTNRAIDRHADPGRAKRVDFAFQADEIWRSKGAPR
jgi:hypothetical protein